MIAEKPPAVINGKTYPLWQQFVDGAEKWIGGIMEDKGDSLDRALGSKPASTKITGIVLRPNGTDSAFFEVKGEEFDCGFGVQYCGIVGGEKGWITFSGYGGHSWRIKTP